MHIDNQYLGSGSQRVEKVLISVLDWSKQQSYRGFNKHDGLNSRVLSALLGWSKWSRLIAIQSVMRAPINLRPIFLVPKSYNPKGLSLFSRAHIDRYVTSGNVQHLQESEYILKLLRQLISPGNWSGNCWGYHYPWQDLGFYAKTNTPNAVVTCFVCEAFLHAYRVNKKTEYLEIVESAIRFLLNDLPILKNENDELCLAYMPLPMTMRVLDVSILIGAVIAQYEQFTGSKTYLDSARRLVSYVVHRQTEYGAWHYTDPPGDSPICHDNYHTGFILDALQRYMVATDDASYKLQYDRGLEFYAECLFNSDGSPRWMSDRDYPHDIHGAAQGILTFSRHQNHHGKLLTSIIDWALTNMYDSEGRFYYQKTKRYTKRFTLLRWCNGWMALALATYLRTLSEAEPIKHAMDIS